MEHESMSGVVERLRIRRNPMLDGEREEAADEIERLRAAEKMMVEQFLDQEREATAQAKEIERLRSLLREWLDGGEDGADTYEARIREALDDVSDA